MTINVTQAHIDNGVSHCRKCPVALAILAVLDKGLKVQVCDIEIVISPEPHYKWTKPIFETAPPDVVRSFIYTFDSKSENESKKHPLQPFSFELNIPEILLCSPST